MASRPGAGAGERPGLAARKTAARLLAAIVDRRTPADGLTDDHHGHPQYLALEPRDRALVRAILATTLRYRMTISAMLAERLDRPLPANAATLGHILHVALAQMLFLDVPDRAAVDLAVAHAGDDPRTRRFAGLVNAVLRAIGRRKTARLPTVLEKTVDAPDWFAARLAGVYGDEKATAILEAHRRPAPVDLTVRDQPQAWAERLGGIVTPTGSVRLAKLDGPVGALPGYEEGAWWVQDAAAALPSRLLGDVAGRDVADLCAAPGGKTAQIASAGARVTAVDISKNRLSRLAENLRRLRLEATVIAADLTTFEPEMPFDAVLLDAPCSSTGTVRRHPDVPWTKTPDDIAKLADLQSRLLAETVRLTKPGGVIVFANCSLDPTEGEAVAEQFVGETPEVEALPVAPGEIAGIDGWITERGWLRTTPADMDLGRPEISGMDGFFAARFRRRG
ncbi:MAG: RsmB/NOP family class I SAM-dependent RNA methyltransferase [Rhizobiaceae bacterium]